MDHHAHGQNARACARCCSVTQQIDDAQDRNPCEADTTCIGGKYAPGDGSQAHSAGLRLDGLSEMIDCLEI